MQQHFVEWRVAALAQRVDHAGIDGVHGCADLGRQFHALAFHTCAGNFNLGHFRIGRGGGYGVGNVRSLNRCCTRGFRLDRCCRGCRGGDYRRIHHQLDRRHRVAGNIDFLADCGKIAALDFDRIVAVRHLGEARNAVGVGLGCGDQDAVFRQQPDRRILYPLPLRIGDFALQRRRKCGRCEKQAGHDQWQLAQWGNARHKNL